MGSTLSLDAWNPPGYQENLVIVNIVGSFIKIFCGGHCAEDMFYTNGENEVSPFENKKFNNPTMNIIFRLVLMKMDTTRKIVSIVDDEIDITELFQDALYANIDGISVVSFNDPALALEHYKQNQQNYALIISDMRMPTMSGIQLLRTVKTLNPYVRTILLSALDMQAVPDLQQNLEEGIIDSYIEKPVTMRRLCQKVKDQVQIYQTKNIHMIYSQKNIKV